MGTTANLRDELQSAMFLLSGIICGLMHTVLCVLEEVCSLRRRSSAGRATYLQPLTQSAEFSLQSWGKKHADISPSGGHSFPVVSGHQFRQLLRLKESTLL